jgi:hypothetical protein
MSADQRYFPDPDETHGDGSLARVFLLALVLLVGLTVIFLHGGLGQLIGDALLSSLGSSRPVPILEYGATAPLSSLLEALDPPLLVA